MARLSGLATLRIDDLRFTGDGLTVLIRVSKTDQDAAGVEVQVPNGVHPDHHGARAQTVYAAAVPPMRVFGTRRGLG